MGAVQVNMLTSSKGTVLRCDVNGKIVMKVFLSGMPDVKLGLNDKLEVCVALLSLDSTHFLWAKMDVHMSRYLPGVR